jgi:hypothetical protein
MNPVTQSLAKRLNDQRLTEFVAHWDALEALVIHLYRGQAATPEDEDEYRRVQAGIAQTSPRWQKPLQLFWRQAQIAGAAVQEDPFVRLTSATRARDFVGDWSAMQTLPAAREALNLLLLDLLNKAE